MRSVTCARAAAAILVTASLATSLPAQAEDAPAATFTGNAGLFSQYIFRGLTQTNTRPALQGGVDYAHPSGFYAGTWLSNISWFSDTNPGTTSSLEWDIYGGWKVPLGDVTLDLGVLRYQYPGKFPGLAAGTVKPNTTEVYAGLAWKWITFKYSYSVDDTFGVEDSKGTDYLDLSASVPVAEGWTVSAHVGRQGFSGASSAAKAARTTNDALYTYTDWKAGVSWAFSSKWSANLAYTDSNAKDAGYTVQGINLGKSAVVFSLTTTF